MKLNDFPRCGEKDAEKLSKLYDWCYELYLYLKGGMKDEQAASEGKGSANTL